MQKIKPNLKKCFRLALSLGCIVLLFIGCNRKPKINKAIQQTEVSYQLIRFDSIFAKANPTHLPQLKHDFPFFFPEQFADSVWVEKMTDSIQQEINAELKHYFSDFSTPKQEITNIFKHIKYYFPETDLPDVYTISSDVDYRSRVIWTDSIAVISLDNYLGAEHHFYLGLPRYIAAHQEIDFLPVDLADSFVRKKVPPPSNRSFLSKIIYEGKAAYLRHLLLSGKPKRFSLKYSEEAWNFAEQNEAQAWIYFVEKELLYNTDPDLERRFIENSPYSKFYLEIDPETPPGMGSYIGFRIVESYVNNHPEVAIDEWLQLPADHLFKASKFKPKK